MELRGITSMLTIVFENVNKKVLANIHQVASPWDAT